MRGRNTENIKLELAGKMAVYQKQWHAVMRFIHREEYTVFNNIGEGRRKKEVYDEIKVIIAMN